MITTKKNSHLLSGTDIVHQRSSFARDPLLYNVTQMGYAVCGTNWLISRSKYSAFALIYIESGTMSLSIDDKEFFAGTGDLLFFDMMKKHTFKNISSENVHIYYMYLYGPNLAKILDTVCPNENCVLSGFDPSELITSIKELYTTIPAKSEDIYKTSAIIYRILTDIMSQHRSNSHNDEISKVIDFLKHNYKELHSTEKLVEMSHMSKYYFIRQFHSRTGESPKEFITNIRIKESQKLLESTSCSISEIATAVGFQDSRSLIALYRNRLGCTPSEYREKHKQ